MSLSSDPLVAFDFQQRTRLVFGSGVLEQLGEIAKGLQARSVMLVTDSGLRAAGHCDRAERILAAAGLTSIR